VVDRTKGTSDKVGDLDVMTSLETLALTINVFYIIPFNRGLGREKETNLKLRGGRSGAITTNNKTRMGELFETQMKAIDCKLACVSKCNKKKFSIMQVG
jgi:hypothetical protein